MVVMVVMVMMIVSSNAVVRLYGSVRASRRNWKILMMGHCLKTTMMKILRAKVCVCVREREREEKRRERVIIDPLMPASSQAPTS